jgi:hypothetical protein
MIRKVRFLSKNESGGQRLLPRDRGRGLRLGGKDGAEENDG